MKRILCDMDGVVADCLDRWLELLRTDCGNDNIHVDDVTEYEVFNEKWGITKAECYQPLGLPGFFSSLEPIAGAIEGVRELQERGYEVVFVTYVAPQSVTGEYDKRIWLQRFMPFVPKENFVTSKRKGIIQGDLLIDDSPANLDAFDGYRIVFDALYNQGYEDADARVKAWSEIPDIVDELLVGRPAKERERPGGVPWT